MIQTSVACQMVLIIYNASDEHHGPGSMTSQEELRTQANRESPRVIVKAIGREATRARGRPVSSATKTNSLVLIMAHDAATTRTVASRDLC